MALSSMTGFARSHGASGPYTFEWELKSVNAKGFDLRVRLPQGKKASRVQLLVAGGSPRAQETGGYLTLTVPSIEIHEVVPFDLKEAVRTHAIVGG